jgi:choloylglycine hydrolase
MRRLHALRAALTISAAAALAVPPVAASACTSLLLKADDGSFVYGRTMEFALPLNSQLIVVPRNLAIKAVGPDGKAGSGLAYATKYGAIGANGLGLPIIVDGINEKGLAAGMLFFPGLAGFQDVGPAEAANSIASYEIATYILTQFANIDEVKAGLPRIKVNRAPQEVFKTTVPLHVTVHDATGRSLVVEYVGGQLQMTDNPVSVLTNSPAIAWHLGNLAQYANVTASPGASFSAGGASFAPWSSGTGMNGIPGDMSAASRFVRASFYVANAPRLKTGAEGLGIAFHLLNQFDIPPGAVRTAEGGAGGGVAGYEVTEWTAAADLKAGVYQIKTYADPQVRQLAIRSVDLDARAVRFIPLDQKLGAIDVSK